MTTNVRFVWNNFADDVSALTATSAADTLVAANLIVDERAAVWRSTTLAAQTLDFQWTDTQNVDSICLAWTNLTSAATVQAKGYTNVGDVSSVFDQTVSPDTGLTISNVTVQNWLAAAYNVKQVKVIITDAANPDGYVEVSRACIGKRIEPVRNMAQEAFSVGWREQAKPIRAESRDLRREPLGRYRYLNLNLYQLELTSRDAIINMVNAGLGNGVFVSAMPENANASTRQLYAFWGALVEEADFGYAQLDRWAAPLVFEEMG